MKEHLSSSLDPPLNFTLLLAIYLCLICYASIAWNGLLESEKPRQLDANVQLGISSVEPNIRKSTIRLLNLWKDAAATKLLGQLLSDVHPDVRSMARESLLEFAKNKELTQGVIETATKNLDSNWQGKQQGLIVLTRLDHKPAAKKILTLLDHDRAEVHITAGWALENLSVEST